MDSWVRIEAKDYNRLKVGDTVRAFHILKQDWALCNVESLLEGQRIWLKAECDEGFRFVVDLNSECVFLFKIHLDCTCGAKHTSNPTHHLPFCECNCEEF